MTGAILPLLAKVATGKLNPFANAKLVQALAETCAAPEIANIFNGIFGVAPVTIMPTNPKRTLAKASTTCKNHACLNCVPSMDDVKRNTSSCKLP